MGHRFITDDEFRLAAKKSGQSARGGSPLRKDAGCIEKANGKTLFVLSTSAPDRSNDVVEQSGWQLDNFRANPVVLYAHDSGAPPIGASPNLYIDEKGRLVSEGPVFASADVNPFGAMIGKMIDAGFLRAASVGFIPLEWTFNEDRGFYAMDFKRQELIEWSVVPVPANPEALIGAKSAGIDLAPMMAWASKALDEKRGAGVLELHHLEAVYKALAPRAVPVTREPGAATVCMCDAGPLVKCQECGGHKRAAISDDAYPKDGDKAAIAELTKRVAALEAKPAAGIPPVTHQVTTSTEDERKAVSDSIHAAVKAETDQLLGRVS